MNHLSFGTFLAPTVMPVYQAVADEVGRRLGVETDLVVETDYEACAKDKREVCFVCGLAYVEFERQGISPAVPLAAPVLAGERYGGRPIYFSDVIVHRDSPFRTFLDLRGRSWAYNEPLSHSGYGITRYHLVEIGETRGFFGEVIEAGFHQESMRMVAAREVDASAIDSQVLAVAMRDDPIAGSRTACHRRPRPLHDPAGRRVKARPARVAPRDPADVLTSMHEDEAVRERLAIGLVERFVPVDASSYDDIRGMVEACRAAEFMEIR